MLGLKVIKRTGDVVSFDEGRIRSAITKAVHAVGPGLPDAEIDRIISAVSEELQTRFKDFFPNVENVQDIVEKHLVREQYYEIAKAYILYRADRQKIRDEAKERAIESAKLGKLTVTKRDGRTVLFNARNIAETIERASAGLNATIDVDRIIQDVIHNVYDGVTTEGIDRALVLAATSFIEKDPAYSFLSSRLLLQRVRKEVTGRSLQPNELDSAYRESFCRTIREGIERGSLDPALSRFDLDALASRLVLERDLDIQFIGMQTLYERYFLRFDESCVELPQGFFMRVAMGLAINEDEGIEHALRFYDLMSTLRYMPSTPTLFHAATAHPQLSSCYLTTIDDDLKHIFKCFGDNAMLSKWSGGIGNDWTNVRGTGSFIGSTQVESQGVVPFLKIANDVTNAINRSGKRRGATCAYLETWHYDIEEFLDLRKNTGDDRRRTHDMNTANWIPDLFMKRVEQDAQWTLFSPNEAPDLHDKFGREFETAYEEYERQAERGEMRNTKSISARQLWRKMLTMLFETGHPWITFKDPCNLRSPQDHTGVIHSSNLCTEITLNTSAEETAVCNLGSINLARHVIDGKLDRELLANTVQVAIRLLDNVIDINFYPTQEAKDSNLRHRPIGLGQMGFQDALYKLDVAFDSQEAVELADQTSEFISYHAILSSSKLAKERGAYGSYSGSKWDRGIFPLDTLDLLEKERGVPVEVSRSQSMDWTEVREHVRRYGMRNSNTMAIAPTATISNIAGCFPCAEPIYKNIYVKANISGEFTIVNSYLVEDLKKEGFWNDRMLDMVKYHDGSVSRIEELPERIRNKYKEAFEISPQACLDLAARRGKWIDQSQSHNVFMSGASGKLLSEIYRSAWRKGLKTTYYLRTLAATQIEKSTLDASKYGFTQKRSYETSEAENGSAAQAGSANLGTPVEGQTQVPEAPPVSACRIDDPECEACQ